MQSIQKPKRDLYILILFKKTFSIFNHLQKVCFFWPGKQEFIKFVLQISKLSADQSLSGWWKDYLQIEVQSANPRFMRRSKFNLQMGELSPDKGTICRSKNVCNWFATDFQLQLTDLQLQFVTDGCTSRTLLLLPHADWHDR